MPSLVWISLHRIAYIYTQSFPHRTRLIYRPPTRSIDGAFFSFDEICKVIRRRKRRTDIFAIQLYVLYAHFPPIRTSRILLRRYPSSSSSFSSSKCSFAVCTRPPYIICGKVCAKNSKPRAQLLVRTRRFCTSRIQCGRAAEIRGNLKSFNAFAVRCAAN